MSDKITGQEPALPDNNDHITGREPELDGSRSERRVYLTIEEFINITSTDWYTTYHESMPGTITQVFGVDAARLEPTTFYISIPRDGIDYDEE